MLRPAVSTLWRSLPVASCTEGVAAESHLSPALGCRLTGLPCPAHCPAGPAAGRNTSSRLGCRLSDSRCPALPLHSYMETEVHICSPCRPRNRAVHRCPLTAALPTCRVLHCHADTDMEAEVEPSVEGEEALRAEEAAAQQRLAQLARWALRGAACELSSDISVLLMAGCQRRLGAEEAAASEQCLAQLARWSTTESSVGGGCGVCESCGMSALYRVGSLEASSHAQCMRWGWD